MDTTGRPRLRSDGGQPKISTMSDEIDAKIAASEARQETRLAQALGEMRAQNAEILGEFKTFRSEIHGEFQTMRADINGRFEAFDARLQNVENSTAGLKWFVISTGLAVVFGIVSVMAWGDNLFSRGMSVQQATDQSAQRAVEAMTSRWQQMIDDARQR